VGVPLGINEEYDPTTDTWTTKTSIPTLVDAFGVTTYDNLIYVIGGDFGPTGPHQNYTNRVYNPAIDTWENRADIPTPRGRLDANLVDGKIYVIGGTTKNSPYITNVNEAYDPETDNWTTKAQIPTAVNSYASAVVDKKIYVIGGFVQSTPPDIVTTRLTQIYDTETDTWSHGAPIPTNISLPVAAATTGEFAPKRIHVLSNDSHCVYDPITDIWTTATKMPTPRSNLGVAIVNDTLYTIGGTLGNNSKAATNEQYTPTGYIPEFPTYAPIIFMLIIPVGIIGFYKRKLSKVPVN